MATPRDNSYSVASGGAIYAGLDPYVPAWRLAMSADTWAEVPVVASLSTLNPTDDPALNPNFPDKPEYMSSSITSWNSMFGAWNGGAWDELRQRWSNVRSGGHADNASNEQFGLSLLADAPQWTRTTPPSGYDGTVTTNDQARLVSGSGSTVVLASGLNAPLLHTGLRDEASDVDDFYNGMALRVFGQTERTITDYVGATRSATVTPAFSVDMADRLYSIHNAGPMVHGLKGEQTGRYSDGRMRSIHSYNRIIYVPAADAYFVPVIGSTSWTASQGTYDGCKIDRATGAETFISPPPSPLTGFGPSGSGSCLDTSRGAQGTIWWMGVNGSRLGKLDVATLTWSAAANIGAQSGATSLCRLPGDLILMGFTGGGFKVFDCAAETLHTPTFSGSAAGGVSDYGQAQPVYVAADNAVYWWNNPSGSTAVLNRMVVPTNPKTDAWTITQTTPHASNAVTPSARQTNGTYGRFCYSAALDGFLLLNNVDGPVYFYARADL